MGYLFDDDFDDLPEDDHDAFAKLESISRGRFHQLESDQYGNYDYLDVMSYMNEVAALAEQFGIQDITYDQDPESFQREYGRFTRAVEYQLAQIKVRRARRVRRESVSITGANRERIQHHLEKIKGEIEAADIPASRKRALMERLGEFEFELSKKRFNLARAMALFALAAAAVHDFSGTLLDTPKIIQTISGILGKEQITEDEQTKLLPAKPPLKALEDQRVCQPKAFDADLDDDVPF